MLNGTERHQTHEVRWLELGGGENESEGELSTPEVGTGGGPEEGDCWEGPPLLELLLDTVATDEGEEGMSVGEEAGGGAFVGEASGIDVAGMLVSVTFTIEVNEIAAVSV